MTINELIAALEEARDDLGGDREVLVANQPTYPLTNVITAVSVTDGDEDDEPTDRRARALWIAVSQPGAYGDLNPYAPADVWDARTYA